LEGTGLVDPDRQWHPLRLAEDFATADIMTGGRVVFGVGRGYHTREVETFGSPMLDDIVMKAFHSETFSHQGKHYTLPPSVPYRGYELRELTLVPRPLRQPVECWQPVVSASARGLDFMMKHRIKGLIGEASERAGLGFVPGLTPEQNTAAMGRGGWAAAGVPRSGRGSRVRPRSSSPT